MVPYDELIPRNAFKTKAVQDNEEMPQMVSLFADSDESVKCLHPDKNYNIIIYSILNITLVFFSFVDAK